MDRLTGKVAIVTGTAGGLGSAFARRLVEEGAQVLLTDIQDAAELALELGPQARFLAHDVTSETDWQRVIEAAEKDFGPVSALVNNAGVGADNRLIEAMAESDYRRIVDINQVSVFLGMKNILPSMKRAGGGAIINISSVGGLRGAPASLAYVASKFAVCGMTKVAALEYAAHNIRVNSVHPGFTRTPMVAPSARVEEKLKPVLGRVPAGRLGDADEIANMVVLLASDEARFATGAEFVIDGGLTCKLV